MKKILFFAAIIICSLTSYSQKDSAVTVNNLTVKQIYEDVKNGFHNLVSNLEGPAKHVYKVYLNQHLTYGISFFSFVFLFGILGILIFKFTYKKAFEAEDINFQCFAAIIGSIIIIVSILCLAFEGPTALQSILNPEYYAIQDVIKTIK